MRSGPDPVPSVEGRRSRRSLLVGAAAAAGVLVTHAVTPPIRVDAANGSTARVGRTNTGTDPTRFRNTRKVANARGLVGQTTWTGGASQSAGVEGESKGANGIGVFGKAHNGSGARAVLGISTSGTGVRGQGAQYGVYGVGDSAAGVYGTGPYGVHGAGTTAGVIATSAAGYGVYAQGPVGATGIGSGSGYGVWGYNDDTGGYGVVGQGGYRGVYGSGSDSGVFGTSSTYAVRGDRTGTGYAGYFTGPVHITGTLTKAGGSFMIDHPLEPARRYLVHSFVEGPERLNVYRGTVRLNSRGRATVRLPRYFDAANRSPSYQLTAVGAAAPDLHIAKGVADNRFVIAGGAAGLSVCWQVTAERDDAWARKNPLRVEQLKRKADRGTYLNPEVLGKPRSAGMHRASRPRVVKPRALRGKAGQGA